MFSKGIIKHAAIVLGNLNYSKVNFKWAKPDLFFVYFRSFNMTNKAQICLYLNERRVYAWDLNRTRSGRMAGADESTEL